MCFVGAGTAIQLNRSDNGGDGGSAGISYQQDLGDARLQLRHIQRHSGGKPLKLLSCLLARYSLGCVNIMLCRLSVDPNTWKVKKNSVY